MRLLPQSLFGRMVFILLGGLTVAQLLSAAINLRERDQLLYRTSSMQSAQRIADIVKLLDRLRPAERSRIAAVLDSPLLRIALDRSPAGQDQEEGDAALFASLLRGYLGPGWPIRVEVIERIPEKTQASMAPMDMDMMAMMENMPMYRFQHGLSFLAWVRLRDGQWVTFGSGVESSQFAWPYRLLASLLLLLAAVVVLSLIAVRWITGPLRKLSMAAEELGKNINRPPLAEAGPTEVRQAARAFNDMQSRLLRYIEDRTRVLAAISHDLKTPITRLRLRTELLDEDKLRTKFTADLDEMESMAAATLDFLRGAGSEETAQPVDVMALLESLAADAREMGYEVRIEGLALKPYPGKPQALKRCIGNLVDNALKYGQRATLSVHDDAQKLRITVKDEGPGIPEHELERVFEPFYRLEGSRNRDSGGAGLGLGIARNIAEAHGGHLTLRNLPGRGLEAVLVLPR